MAINNRQNESLANKNNFNNISVLRSLNFSDDYICILAVASGNELILEYFHQQGHNLNSFLPLAIAAGQLHILSYLHQQGVDISQSLNMIIVSGHVEILRYFHQQGGDISQAAFLAITAGKLEILQYLHQNGVKIDPVISSSASAKLQILRYLHQQGVDISQTLPLAIVTDQVESLRYLHQQGMNISHTLPLAIVTSKVECIRYLHQQGVDMSMALPLAIVSGQLESICYLNKHGIDISQSLPLAIVSGQIESIRYLNNLGFNSCNGINTKNLISCIAKDQKSIIKYLHENNLIENSLSNESDLRLTSMTQEVLNSPPIYHPSQFWHIVGDAQRAHLRHGGEANFKRTINQSYCNFIPNSSDDPLITHIEKYHKDVNISSATYTIEDPDNDPNLWFTFYEQYQVFQGDRELRKKLYLYFVSKIYEYTLNNEETKILGTLEEPTLGNPIKLYRNGTLISQDLVTSVSEHNSVMRNLNLSTKTQNSPLIIGELGAGYGRLAYVFLKTTRCRYMVFDIPPALHISEWYLSTLFPEKRIFKFKHFDSYEEIKEELALAEIAFFTPNQLSLFPHRFFDAFITISSLHEMSRAQIQHFIQQMSLVTKDVIYIKQYWKYLNSHDNLCITASEYEFPSNFTSAEKTQDVLNPLFFEMVSVRKTVSLPSISILLSNFNHAHYLPESLTAICEQTVPATEIIIVDDGSTDNSIAVIEKFKKEYPHIILLRNPENKGLIYSINRALNTTKSDYIVWASADDKLLLNFIEENLKCIKLYPNAALCFSKLSVFQDKTNIMRFYTEENHGKAFDLGKEMHELSPEDLITRLQTSYLWMSGNTVVAKRSAILEAGGILENLRWHADWFAYYGIALRYGVCVVPETLAMMRERPNTYSKRGMTNRTAQYKVLGAILNTLYEPKNKDILNSFLKAPCLLSPFGTLIFVTLFMKPRYWKLLIRYSNWYLFFHQKYHQRALYKAKTGIYILRKRIKKIGQLLNPRPTLGKIKRKLLGQSHP